MLPASPFLPDGPLPKNRLGPCIPSAGLPLQSQRLLYHYPYSRRKADDSRPGRVWTMDFQAHGHMRVDAVSSSCLERQVIVSRGKQLNTM